MDDEQICQCQPTIIRNAGLDSGMENDKATVWYDFVCVK